MPSFSYNKGNEKEGGFHSGYKRTEHTFQQKNLMIRMLSERLDEKDETINDLKKTIAGLRGTLDK